MIDTPVMHPPGRDAGQALTDSLAILRQGGLLSQRLPGYRERPAQITMAAAVIHALQENSHAVIEATTGIGKSLAYLVPVVCSDKITVISTSNKALQEQLFYKDIPFVQQYIKPFTATLAKGINNYICLDRLNELQHETSLFGQASDIQRVLQRVNDPTTPFTGDFETLPFALSHSIRSLIATESEQCAWSRCPFYPDCYVRKMRDASKESQVIVVNHTLLLLDAAIGGFLLPRHEIVVLDEAHHLDDEAMRILTSKVRLSQVESLMSLRTFQSNTSLSLRNDAIHLSSVVWRRLGKLLPPEAKKDRTLLTQPIEEGQHLATVIDKLAEELSLHQPQETATKEAVLFRKLLTRTRNLANTLHLIFPAFYPPEYVYYIERGEEKTAPHLQVVASPIDVAPWLRKDLFGKWTIIATSATLATTDAREKGDPSAPSLAYFRRRVGLDQETFPHVNEVILPLTFDYAHQALLYIPQPCDIPEPIFGDTHLAQNYIKAVARQMHALITASQGRALLLFSSRKMMDTIYALLVPTLKSYRVLRQGDLPRTQLIEEFKQGNSVLLALRSFWEGIDIAGEALSLVVIDKLPFDPPDSPVVQAIQTHLKEAGANPFSELLLPQTILRLKQGVGRLLRRHDDRGVIAILDTRLRTKPYASFILACLPPAKITDQIQDVRDFFGQGI